LEQEADRGKKDLQELETGMRWLPTVLGVAAAFLMGAALAVATNPRPLFREIVMRVTGASAYDRCVKAGACNATQATPHDVPSRVPRLRRQEAPPDMDRA
jgi:hypothetical protein